VKSMTCNGKASLALGCCQVCFRPLHTTVVKVNFCDRPVDYEALQPRLEALLLRHQEDIDSAAALEKRVARIVRQYTMQVCMLLLPGHKLL
jgi:hypothetical protein